LNGASLLVLANKADCSGALALDTIKAALGLDRLDGTSHHWSIFSSSALNGTNIAESLHWLSKEIQSRRGQ
jgi:hypothetical protein